MQFIIFRLGSEYFATETEKIQNISDIMQITKVPTAPAHIKGLINLRGSIKPLVDIHQQPVNPDATVVDALIQRIQFPFVFWQGVGFQGFSDRTLG